MRRTNGQGVQHHLGMKKWPTKNSSIRIENKVLKGRPVNMILEAILRYKTLNPLLTRWPSSAVCQLSDSFKRKRILSNTRSNISNIHYPNNGSRFPSSHPILTRKTYYSYWKLNNSPMLNIAQKTLCITNEAAWMPAWVFPIYIIGVS